MTLDEYLAQREGTGHGQWIEKALSRQLNPEFLLVGTVSGKIP